MSPLRGILTRAKPQNLHIPPSATRLTSLSSRHPTNFASRSIASRSIRPEHLLPATALFSTMSANQFPSPAPSAATHVSNREWDPEIKDIASYVHNYEIKSDLAVSSVLMVSKTARVLIISMAVAGHCSICFFGHSRLRT